MKLIVGGAYQGKLDFALRLAEDGGSAKETAKGSRPSGNVADGGTGRDVQIADGYSDPPEAAFERKIISHLHGYIRRFCVLEEEAARTETMRFIETIIERNGQAVVVCNELGCGIVPVVKEDRLWRELTGAACQRLAGQSDEVFRIVCGLPQRLKGGGA